MENPKIAKNGPGGSEPTESQEIALNRMVGEYIEDKKPVDMQFLKEFWRVSHDANDEKTVHSFHYARESQSKVLVSCC